MEDTTAKHRPKFTIYGRGDYSFAIGPIFTIFFLERYYSKKGTYIYYFSIEETVAKREPILTIFPWMILLQNLDLYLLFFHRGD